jgi:ribosomal protein L12E/L44/L45/RPP1/RPP2
MTRPKLSGAKKENEMKMKTSLLVGAFSLALFMAGCTAAPAAAPVAGPAGPQGATGATGDPGQDATRRTEEERRAEEARRAEDQRITDARARDSHDTGCPGGEHVSTAPDGRKSCVRD